MRDVLLTKMIRDSVGRWLMEWIDRDGIILSLSSSTSNSILSNVESDQAWIHPWSSSNIDERERGSGMISLSLSPSTLYSKHFTFSFPFSFSLPWKYTKYTRNLTSALSPTSPAHPSDMESKVISLHGTLFSVLSFLFWTRSNLQDLYQESGPIEINGPRCQCCCSGEGDGMFEGFRRVWWEGCWKVSIRYRLSFLKRT